MQPDAVQRRDRIHSEGGIVAASGSSLALDDQVRYGTRHLTLALSNIGVDAARLSNAATRQVLPAGLTLSQTVLDRLCVGAPNTATGPGDPGTVSRPGTELLWHRQPRHL